MIKDFDKIAIIAGDRRVSYREMLQRISLFSTLTPYGDPKDRLRLAESRMKVVIFSENREGYIYSFFSIWSNSGIVVPVDAMASASELAYILDDCKPSAIWVSQSTRDVAEQAISITHTQIPILLIDPFETMDIDDTITPSSIDYEPEQTALIIYTSGTTGSPKGVKLSFKNLLTNIISVSKEVPIYTPNRRALILLPLHHVLPLQGTMIAPILLGAGVAISPTMSAADIMQTLQRGKVGLFIGVPRLWQSLYDGIMKKINASHLTRALYWICQKLDSPAVSRVVFHKIHKMMGGHLEACPSGGAALDPAIWRGLHVLGLEIIEGYGMTECAPIITFSRPDDLHPGCVGKPLPSCSVSIIDDEICVMGDNIMQGYYNNPEETAATIDSNGWLHTGDLGFFDKQGRLYITGRKKEIIVLSNGKNINPVEIEAKLESHTDYVKEAAVIEENQKLKAIICPQPLCLQNHSIQELESLIKREIIDPYNKVVATYKNITGIYLYQGELPRTRIDKIQRFKLSSIVNLSKIEKERDSQSNPMPFRSSEEYGLIKSHIEKEKKIIVHYNDNLITDLGLDSLDIIDLQCMIEQCFGFQIDQEQILSKDSVGLLSEYVADHRKKLERNSFNLQKELMMDTERCHKPQMAKSGWWIVCFTRFIMNRYFHTSYSGKYNIPKSKQFIIVANHQSYLDSLFVVQGLSKEQVNNTCFFAKEQHVNTPLRRFLASKHCVYVLRSREMKNSILEIGRALKMGANLLIFPEGTRTSDGELNEFRPTFAMLSILLNIPVLPVCIQGAYEAMPKHRKIPSRKKVSIHFLPPICPNLNDTESELIKKVEGSISKRLHMKSST